MKRLVITGLGVVIALGMSAAPLTPEEALARLNSSAGHNVKGKAEKLNPIPAYTTSQVDGTPVVYVFNENDGEGFKVVSADDSAVALLGYSDKGVVSRDKLAPGLKWWLEEMTKVISANGSKGVKSQARVSGNGRAAIAPLCASKWDQAEPYNNDAPTLSGRHCYTGCVATSMAQLMYYHKYPAKGEGVNTYEWTRAGRTLSMNFSTVEFDWSNMIDVYQRNSYSEAQGAAVAELMKACGYSTNMNYGLEASGTQGALIAYALRTFFGYDGNCHAEYRMGYSASEWDKMVYDNLKNVGPVIFNGHPYEDGGHSFICDGYDGNGYYHFNWGWGGMSDGYYLLESMNPEGQGIGGAESTGFVYGLNGIFGAQKPTGQPVVERQANLLMYGGCYAEVSGSRLIFHRNKWYPDGWFNGTDRRIDVFIGALFTPVDGTPGEDEFIGGGIGGGSARVQLGVGYYMDTSEGPVVEIGSLANGKYKVYVATRDRGVSNPTPVPVTSSYGTPNYVYLTVKDGTYTVENVPVIKLSAKAAKIATPLYFNKNCRIELTLGNESDYELTETLAVVLSKDGKNMYTTGGIPMTANAKSDEQLSLVSKFVAVSGVKAPTASAEYDLKVVNPITDEVLGSFGKVVMEPAPSVTTLYPTKFEFEGCERVEEETIMGTMRVYQVPTEIFTYLLEYNVTRGFFDGVIGLSIYTPNPEGNHDMMPVVENFYTSQPFLEEGESDSLKVPYTFAGAVKDQLYVLRVMYSRNNSYTTLAQSYFKIKDKSGIDEVEVAPEVPVRYFNLQGVEVNSPKKGEILIEMKDGKAHKVVY